LSKLGEELKGLLEKAELYMDQILPEEEIRFCIDLVDTGERVTLVLKDEPEVLAGSVEPDARLYMERHIFDGILQGEADIFSLIARARITDTRPVEFEVYDEGKAQEIWEVGKAFLTYFFTPGRVKVKRLAPELAGEAHGAHPIPLVYWDGMRSSWIHMRAGELLNEEGERDPWPQLFVIQRGTGSALIGEEEFSVEPNTVVYVPVDAIHQVRAETDIELIWLAWKA